ncbi:hypothetical protein FO488_04155 [Geobacter sp. FeAm09]|nr:hypothetical protein FO488_04155 [Geobacter sp. FeAm09]
MKKYLKPICVGLALLALYGCGGDGDGGPAPITDSYLFPAGKATITFTAMSTAKLAAPLSGIDLSLTLPQGMSVTTASGASGPIATDSVTPGSALTGTNLAFGTYSATTRKVILGMVTTSNSYRSGEFLRLTCTVAANTSITLGGLKTGAPVTVVKAVGYDPVSKSTVTLTGNIKVNLGAVR